MKDFLWRYAPVLVGTNHQRMIITRMKAMMWAREHKTFVFKWKGKIRSHVNAPVNIEAMAAKEEEHPFFWQYFVEAAECFITNNINGDLALVNGTPGTLHSLVLSELEQERIEECMMNQPYGSEIEIEEPVFVNVSIQKSLDGKPISSKRQRQLEVLQSISGFQDDSEIVIPIGKQRRYGKNDFQSYTYPNGNPLEMYATVEVADIFPIQLAFAMTIHKAQGRTIKRVVIDLMYHPNGRIRLKFAAIFVALSRVKCKEDLRLLHRPKKKLTSAYGYITEMRQHADVTAFYNGFTGNEGEGLRWCPQTALGL